MITRRQIIQVGVTLPVLTWSGAVRAQPITPPVIIGWLNTGSSKTQRHLLVAFKEGMSAVGRKEGTHYVVEERWSEGRPDRTSVLAAELAAKKPTIIVAAQASGTAAAAKAAPNTPIVQAYGGPLVERGLANSLARPGGMVTGIINLSVDMSEKRLELLLDVVPSVRRVGFIIDMSTPVVYEGTVKAARRSLEHYRVDGYFGRVARPDDIEAAIVRLAKDGVQALIVMPGVFLSSYRERIVTAALAQRWPMVTGSREYAEAGALLSYGTAPAALYRRSAYYVDRILKGANPGDLPIEQPAIFEMVVNLKTAKSLGLTIPQTILVRADRVIE